MRNKLFEKLEIIDQPHTFKKRKKDEYHEVPVVLLYSFHLAPPRENESCIDETSGEATELHFLLTLWLQRHLSNWGRLHTSVSHCWLILH